MRQDTGMNPLLSMKTSHSIPNRQSPAASSLIAIALLSVLTMASCSESPGATQETTPETDRTANPALDHAEREAGKIFEGYLAALDQDAKSGNPLNKTADAEKLKADLAAVVQPLVGQTLALKGVVSGFEKGEGGEVRVALVNKEWWNAFPEGKEAVNVRLRLRAESFIQVANASLLSSGSNSSTPSEMQAMVVLRMLAPYMEVLSPMSAVALVGTEIYPETAGTLVLDSLMEFRVKVKEWRLMMSGRQERPLRMSSRLAVSQSPELQHLNQLFELPYIVLDCEWEADAGKSK